MNLTTTAYKILIDRKVIQVGLNGSSEPDLHYGIDIEGKAFEDEKRQYVYMVHLLRNLQEIEFAVGDASDEKIELEYNKIKGRVVQQTEPEEDLKS